MESDDRGAELEMGTVKSMYGAPVTATWCQAQRYLGAVWRPPSSTLPSCSPVRKLMSQGTSGPSGHIGLQLASSPLFGGNYVVSQPASTQTSPEQSIANQIRKLTVRVLSALLLTSSELTNPSITQAHCRNAPDIARGTIDGPVSQMKTRLICH